jgi:hypothetical protein
MSSLVFPAIDLHVLSSADQLIFILQLYNCFCETIYLKEVKCTKPSPKVGVPWFIYDTFIIERRLQPVQPSEQGLEAHSHV